jgi:hypothetical protein
MERETRGVKQKGKGERGQRRRKARRERRKTKVVTQSYLTIKHDS